MGDLIIIWVFWISFALGFYVYFIYPLVLGIVTAIWGKRNQFSGFEFDKDLPPVALMIACFNEEKEILKKLENTLIIDYPPDKLQIVVLNDGSSDSTSELISDFINDHPGSNIKQLDFTENRGKSRTLVDGVEWVGINHPEIEILAFTDANAHWETGALKKLIVPFSNPEIGSVSGLLRYINPENGSAGQMEGLYWKYETFIKKLSSRLGTLPGANGSIFAVRLDAYQPLNPNRGDDYELPVMAIINGYRSILVEDAKSFEPPSSDFTAEYRRKMRITGQMLPSTTMLCWKALAKGRGLIAFQLFSHKLLRYFVPFYQIFLLVSAGLLWFHSAFYTTVFILQVMFYILAALGLLIEKTGSRPPKFLQIPLYFTMVNLASLMSIIRVALGRKIRWERNR
ncbi:MAG: glycosyltransferase family 2 protein [bacterium]|nr:glycosyltransferase family 2 protein [bacterium]